MFLSIANSSIEGALAQLVSTGRENLLLLFSLGLSSLFIGTVGPLLVLTLILFQIYRLHHSPFISLTQFWANYLSPMVIESLRVLGQTLFWFLLGIFPGAIKYVQWALTPFIVVFDQKYSLGKIDALEHSHKLLKGSWWKAAVLLTLPISIDFAFSAINNEQKLSLFNTPILSLSATLLVTITEVFACSYFFLIIHHENSKAKL